MISVTVIPLQKCSEQPVAEGFEADGGEHDFYVLLLCQRQDISEDRGVSIDIIDPANQIDLRELDPVPFRLLEQVAQGTDRVFVNQFEGDLPSVHLREPCDLSDDAVALHQTVVALVP